MLPVVPMANEIAVRDEYARRIFVGLEDADGLAGLDEERLVVFEFLEGADDGMEAVPVSCRLARAAVDDEVVGFFRNFRIEVVHEHAESGFLVPAFAAKLGSPRGTDGGLGRHAAILLDGGLLGGLVGMHVVERALQSGGLHPRVA